MKVHIGVDVGSGYVTAVEGTSVNVHDVTVASKLLRPEDDHVMYGDCAYLGLEKREEIANHPTLSGIERRVNRRPRNIYRKYANNGQAWEKVIERQKSAVRSKVEFPFRFLKVQCGFRKTVYKGIAKNLNRVFMLLASCNLYACARAGRSLYPVTGGDHPTLFRRIDGQQSRYLFLCAQVQFWCLMHQPSQVTIGIQAVYFRGFNHTIYDGAGFRASGHIGEQEILSSHHKGFDAAFSPIVADFKPAILQIVEQMRPVLSRVLYSLSQQ